VGYVPLGGDEETHIIFLGNLPDHLSRLNANEQRDSLTKLKNVANEEAPPDNYIYEQIKNIDILRYSDKGRIWTTIITNIPEKNSVYHVIYVLFIDAEHDYSQGQLGRYNVEAQQKVDEMTSLSTVDKVEDYLKEHDSIDEDGIKELLER
jgi:phage-related protein